MSAADQVAARQTRDIVAELRTNERGQDTQRRAADKIEQLRDAAENALATLDNVLAHYGDLMPEGDRSGRRRTAEALRAALTGRAPAEMPFSQERAAMDDLNFLRERVFRHYASGDIVAALRAPIDLAFKVEPPELAARLHDERALAALEIELLRERVSIMGRQR